MDRYKRLTYCPSLGNEGQQDYCLVEKLRVVLARLRHLFYLFLPVSYPYFLVIPPITHLLYDMGYRWDIYGISMGYLRNNIKEVVKR